MVVVVVVEYVMLCYVTTTTTTTTTLNVLSRVCLYSRSVRLGLVVYVVPDDDVVVPGGRRAADRKHEPGGKRPLQQRQHLATLRAVG